LLVLPSLASVSEAFFSYLPTIMRNDFYLPLLAGIINIASFVSSNFAAYFLDKTAVFVDSLGVS